MLITVKNSNPFEAGKLSLSNLEWELKNKEIFIKPNIGATFRRRKRRSFGV